VGCHLALQWFNPRSASTPIRTVWGPSDENPAETGSATSKRINRERFAAHRKHMRINSNDKFTSRRSCLKGALNRLYGKNNPLFK
jgi:hypothetical protein